MFKLPSTTIFVSNIYDLRNTKRKTKARNTSLEARDGKMRQVNFQGKPLRFRSTSQSIRKRKE
jgi:hypothetical protein